MRSWASSSKEANRVPRSLFRTKRNKSSSRIIGACESGIAPFHPALEIFCSTSSGIHYLQEDHPDVIGANVKKWLIELGIASGPKQKLKI
jgi:hypothetical protein